MQRTECENKWCIYYEEGYCTIAGISINSYGNTAQRKKCDIIKLWISR